MILSVLSGLVFAANTCPQEPYWPVEGDWLQQQDAARELAPSQVQALDTYLFPSERDDEERTGVRTDSVLIVRDGAIIYEHYGADWDKTKPHLLWSASKSFTASLVGIGVRDGTIDVTKSICDYVKVGRPSSCDIKVQHLMEFSSGLAWRETYEGESPTSSSVLGMLYGSGNKDMSRFVTGHELRDPPGSTYQYSSGDTNVLSDIVGTVHTPTHGKDFAWKLLFEPLGIKSAVWERDGSGTMVGSSTLYLTPRDGARYGAMLLNDGCWNGERILPEGWIDRASQPAPSVRRKTYERGASDAPGWNLWLNQAIEEHGEDKPAWPDAPGDVYGALGHWRQAIFAVPSHDLVIVRFADDRDKTFSYNELIPLATQLAEALPVEEQAAPAAEEPAAKEPPSDPMNPPFATLLASDAPAHAEPSMADPPDKYDVGLLKLATSWGSSAMCSCMFVSQGSQERCESYIRVQPNVARVRVDRETKTVTSRALGMARTRARWISQRQGCQIVP